MDLIDGLHSKFAIGLDIARKILIFREEKWSKFLFLKVFFSLETRLGRFENITIMGPAPGDGLMNCW